MDFWVSEGGGIFSLLVEVQSLGGHMQYIYGVSDLEYVVACSWTIVIT